MPDVRHDRPSVAPDRVYTRLFKLNRNGSVRHCPWVKAGWGHRTDQSCVEREEANRLSQEETREQRTGLKVAPPEPAQADRERQSDPDEEGHRGGCHAQRIAEEALEHRSGVTHQRGDVELQ